MITKSSKIKNKKIVFFFLHADAVPTVFGGQDQFMNKCGVVTEFKKPTPDGGFEEKKNNSFSWKIKIIISTKNHWYEPLLI